MHTTLNSHVDFYGGRKTGEPGENPRGKGENNTSNKLNSHMILSKLGLEPGTIEVRGERSHRYATHATHNKISKQGQ